MNRFAVLLPAVALLFLAYVAGAVVYSFELPGYDPLNRAFKAFRAQYFSVFVADDVANFSYHDPLGAEPKPDNLVVLNNEVGVLRHNAERALDGFTIFSSGPITFPIYLIDMDGNPVHSWQVPAMELEGPALRADLSESDRKTVIRSRRLRLFPDGSLLVVVSYYIRNTPYGMGLIKLDRDSNLEWQYLKNAHHDFDVGNDGRIYLLTHYIEDNELDGLKFLETPYIAETVTILDAEGNELRTVSVFEAMRDSDWLPVFNYLDKKENLGDPLHVNSVEVIDDDTVLSIPGAQPGDVLLSVRNMDTLLLLNPEQETVTWAVRGYWNRQHDAEILSNGNLLLYDNTGRLNGKGTARILEIDPVTLGTAWEFPGTSDESLHNPTLGSQQRLKNGNTLITESAGGRVLEVTPDLEVVWEYHLPQRIWDTAGEQKRTVAFSAERFTPDELDFEFNLMPGTASPSP